MKISYKDFRDKLRREIWPFAGEAKNLREAHNAHFKEAMIDLGKWVPCLHTNNTSVFPACGTYVQCAITVLPCPVGLIRRVYTIANAEWCDRVFAVSRRYQDILEWSRELMQLTDWVSPEQVAGMPLQKGFRFASSSTDGTWGRSRTLIYAIDRKRLYLAPWIQSNESVVVEWDGYKTDWLEVDLLDTDWWTPDIESAVKQFVRMCHERDFGGDTERYMQAKLEYASALADAMHWCREKTKQIASEVGEEQNIPTVDQLANEGIPDEEAPASYTFGIVGDFGKMDNADAAQDVAAMVNAWGPDHVIALGDMIYPPQTDFAESVGVLYGDFVGATVEDNRFWPCLGNHDYDEPGHSYTPFEDYFSLPHVERYYDICFGPVHFFFYDGTPNEVDGFTETSKQGEWLRVKIALSTATWKIVCKHYPYPSSDPDPGHAAHSANFDFPWHTWGVDVVMGGHFHAYERLSKNGVTHLVCGLGGQTKDTFGAINAYSQVQYDDDYGALKLVADQASLHFTMINRQGVTVDDFTLA